MGGADRKRSHSKRHRGYVAVTVSPSGIREARDPKGSHKGGPKDATSQEEVIKWIAKQTTDWDPHPAGQDLTSHDSGRGVRWPRQIVLLDIAITHSASWDILISVSYREADDFMAYVREVVQMAPHVTGTQTLFVAQSLAQIVALGSRKELPA